MSTIVRGNILSGYGVKIRALRDTDVTEHKIDLTGRDPAFCVAVEGEDLTQMLAAVVDLRESDIVWSSVPDITDETSQDGGHFKPLDKTEWDLPLSQAVAHLVRAVLPETGL